MSIDVDLKRWPIVVVTWAGTVTDADLAEHHRQMTEIVRRDTKKVVIYDASTAAIPSATQRKMQADWLKENDFAIRRYGLGTAFVLSSSLMRGALTAVFWIQGMSTAYHVCSTVREAVGWCEARLGESTKNATAGS